MISRKTTRILAEAYIAAFSTENLRLELDKLSDFIYDENYETWFWNVFLTSHNESLVKQRIMNLHTGDTFQWFKTPFSGALPEERIRVGQDYLQRLAESLLRKCIKDLPALHASKAIVLLLFLELDGYIYKEGTLYPTEHSVIDEKEEQSYLELLIDNLSLSDAPIIKHHLQLSEQAYVDSRWSDTISNARNFLEAILGQIADSLHTKLNGTPLPASTASQPRQVRDYLEGTAFINGVETQTIAKVYGLISNTGSHPNMAHKDQARLMRNLALTFSQYILLQWDGYLKNNP